MKSAYNRPELVNYGSLETLTLGQGGAEPDFRFTNQTLVLVNNSCLAGGTATSCLVPNS